MKDFFLYIEIIVIGLVVFFAASHYANKADQAVSRWEQEVMKWRR